MNPFVDESEALEIGDLKIENRLDRVTVYGRIDVTWDKEGLRNARELRRVFTRIAHALESAAALPDHLPPPVEPVIEPNPLEVKAARRKNQK
jgi:hypothetical protein